MSIFTSKTEDYVNNFRNNGFRASGKGLTWTSLKDPSNVVANDHPEFFGSLAQYQSYGGLASDYDTPAAPPPTPAPIPAPTPTAPPPAPTPANSGKQIDKAVEQVRKPKGRFATYFTAGGSSGLLGSQAPSAGRSARNSLLGS